MKILIIGSMKFAHDMVKVKDKLDRLGHNAVLVHGIEPHLTDSEFVDNLKDNLEFCINNDVMRKCFKQVEKSDAVLVLNKRRNNIDGYIGVSALMEMAIAHFLGKKIFLLNKTPHFDKARWAQEVAIMQPIIIDGKLSNIK